MSYLKQGNLYLFPEYEKLLLIIYGLWFGTSLATRKFVRGIHQNYYHALWPWIKSAILMVAAMSKQAELLKDTKLPPYFTPWLHEYCHFICYCLQEYPIIVTSNDMNEGLIDADLGAGLFKKRIAMPGQGKRGGWRSLLGFQEGNKAFFLYLFPKSRRDNIDAAEMKALKRLTKYYLTLKHAEIKVALQCGELREVTCNEKRT